MLSKRLINSNNAGGGCTDIVDNYDPFGGNGLALYQLNGNADDVSGNYNATASNVTYGTGVFGQAGVFNGTSSVITLPSGSPFNDSDTIKTISAWVKLDTPTSRIRGIYAFGSDDLHFFEFRYIGDNNYISVFARNGSSANQVNYQADLPSPQDTNWHHTVTTFDGTNVKIYFDGQDIPITITKTGSATNSSWISYPNYSGTTVGTIGKSRTATYSNGEIDQVRIFNTALTPLEVEALYTEELCICGGTVDTLDILGDGSCIATYQLDGNANDLSGNYSGTPTDVSYKLGEFDLAGVFNGSRINTPLNINNIVSNINDRTQDFTFSCWLNATDLVGGENILYLGNYNVYSPGYHWIGFGKSGGVVKFEVYDGTAYSISESITSNTWYHVVGIRESSVLKLYVNGSFIGQITQPANTSISSSVTFKIGTNQIGTDAFNGSIDQVRIFNKALNSTEVTTLYNETACTKAACTGTTNTLDILGDGSCIATYPLDGSPADLSGNYNGVQVGGLYYGFGEFDLSANFGGSTGSNKGIETELNISGSHSISVWANVNLSGEGIYKTIFWSQNDASRVRLFGFNDNVLAFAVFGNIITLPYSSYNNTWVHLVCVINSANSMSLYVDGSLHSTISITETITGTGYYDFGKNRADVSWYAAPGSIDQVRVFNKALNQAEVGILFNDETPCN